MWTGEYVTYHGSKKPMVLRRQKRAIDKQGMNELDTSQSPLTSIGNMNFKNRKRPELECPDYWFRRPLWISFDQIEEGNKKRFQYSRRRLNHVDTVEPLLSSVYI